MTKTIEQLQARIAPIPPELAAQLERTDWTPEEALRFYADQKNYDIAGSHVRMIDTGAIASNALKHLSVARLEMKGDAELFELREQLAAAQTEIKRLRDAIEAVCCDPDGNVCIGLMGGCYADKEILEQALSTIKESEGK